jgi:hypothetical protein
MIIRALVRFFPEKEAEVQLFNVDTSNYNYWAEEAAAITLVREYLETVRQTYSDLEVEAVGVASEIEVAPFVAKLQ